MWQVRKIRAIEIHKRKPGVAQVKKRKIMVGQGKQKKATRLKHGKQAKERGAVYYYTTQPLPWLTLSRNSREDWPGSRLQATGIRG